VLQPIGEDGRRKAVRGGVLLLDRLLERIDFDEIENRGECLRLHDRPVVACANDRRFDERPGRARLAAVNHFSAGLLRGLDRGEVALHRLLIDERTHERRGRQRIADDDLRVGIDQAELELGRP